MAKKIIRTIIKRSPATARFAREKLEQELAVRFLTDKLFAFRRRLGHILTLKGEGQRYIYSHHLFNDMSGLCDNIAASTPRRNMTFYTRRGRTMRKV